MRIKAIETAGFGNLPDSQIELDDGLTAVVGANEAGKTFTREAVCQGLYGDGATTSTVLRERIQKWGSTGSFFIKLEIEHEGEDYLIIRDFGEKKNLLIMPDGTEVKDKKRIAVVVEDIVGLPSQASYDATASIPQDEVGNVCGEPSLKEIIEGRIAGAGADTDALIKKVDKAKTRIVTKSGKKGALVEQHAVTEKLETDLDGTREILKALADNKVELNKANQDLAINEQELKDAELAYKGSKKYIAALGQRESADTEFDDAQKSLEKYKQATKDIVDSARAIKELDDRITALQKEIENSSAFDLAREESGKIEKEKSDLSDRIDAVKKLDDEIVVLESTIRKLKPIEAKKLKNTQSLVFEIESLKTALYKLAFRVDVQSEEGTEYSITADGQVVKGSQADVHVEARVEFPGVASVYMKNVTGEEEPIADEISRKEAAFNNVLDEYGVATIEGLEALYKEREDAIKGKAQLEEKRTGVLDNDDLLELETSLRDLGKDCEKAKEKADKLKADALSREELERKRSEKTEAEADKHDSETLLNTSKGVLQVTGDNEEFLSGAVRSAAKRLLIADEALEKYAPYKCTTEAYAKLEGKVENLKGEMARLTEQCIRLSEKVFAETTGEGDAAELEEKLEESQRILKRLSRKNDVLALISENISWARTQSISGFSAKIEKKMGEIISSITDGRYSKVKVDGNLSVSVLSAEKGQYIELDKEIPLSTGTIDQIFLAARLALLDIITGGCRPPVLLDDTFSNFDDMGRKERAFDILESISGEYQVLYFTCHGLPEGVKTVCIG